MEQPFHMTSIFVHSFMLFPTNPFRRGFYGTDFQQRESIRFCYLARTAVRPNECRRRCARNRGDGTT